MKATLITIGDEILIGQTVDTNSAWMGRELSDIGVEVFEILSVHDEEQAILSGLKRASEASDIILITGGLGPTKDDITKLTLAKYFGSTLVEHPPILEAIERWMKMRKRKMLEVHRALSLVPDNCTPLQNRKGTAWGMWFDEGGKVYVSMPGVPYEMKALMKYEVLPRIEEKFHLPIIMHKHILTAGVGETEIAKKIEDIEDGLPPHIKLAYLPGMGFVKLRLTAVGEDKDLLQQELVKYTEAIEDRIHKRIYGYDEDVFEQVIGDMLSGLGKTISTAESCTGGYIAHRITTRPGSSAYFMGSAVTYSNEAKNNLLGVNEETLTTHGAVSEEVVHEMVKGVCDRFKTDFGIAVSGIAGPDGGSDEKPVGTVWIAVGSADNIKARKLQFPGNREQNIELTAVVALELFRKYLTNLV